MSQLLYVSDHCNQRMNQRGISQTMFDLLCEFGETTWGHHAAKYYFFSIRSIQKMIAAGVPKRLIIEAEENKALRAVVGAKKSCAVTVMHANNKNLRVNYKIVRGNKK